ncbi:MAG: DUF2461 domain-containing protein [Chitinophagales bacterium]
MAFFTQDYHVFFQELTTNNSKDWFDENRKRYHKIVKIPFENFVNAIIARVSAFDEPIEIDHKRSVFRINRDIRFSKDKTPYKTNRTAVISKFGTKDKIYPGFYVFTGLDKMMIGGGAYFLEKEKLFQVRQEIAYNMDEFQSIIDDKAFKSTFKQVQGDKNKVLPKDFKEDAEKQPLLFNKGFYFMKEFKADSIFQEEEKLLDTIEKTMKAGKPLNDFLRRAMS